MKQSCWACAHFPAEGLRADPLVYEYHTCFDHNLFHLQTWLNHYIPVLFVFKMVERIPNCETINFLFISSELVELHLSWFSKAGLDVSLFASIGHYLCPAPTCCSLIKVIRHLVASIDAEKHPFLLLSRVPREPLITCLNISACYDK
jgi:hypothetical protein